MFKYGGLVVLTVILRVVGTLMLLGGIVAAVFGLSGLVLDTMIHPNPLDPLVIRGWLRLTLGIASIITGFGMLLYGQLLLLMINIADNSHQLKAIAQESQMTNNLLAEMLETLDQKKRIAA